MAHDEHNDARAFIDTRSHDGGSAVAFMTGGLLGGSIGMTLLAKVVLFIDPTLQWLSNNGVRITGRHA